MVGSAGLLLYTFCTVPAAPSADSLNPIVPFMVGMLCVSGCALYSSVGFLEVFLGGDIQELSDRWEAMGLAGRLLATLFVVVAFAPAGLVVLAMAYQVKPG